MRSARGLLIVNADDWGYDHATTDAIADCYRHGALTSTTAMMWMQDSERAAELTRELPELGVGLHLNLVQEFSDPATPRSVQERQRRFVDYFRLLRLRRWTYDPRVRDDVNALVADQFQRFYDLYGRAPTHLDGHHHCHLAMNVLLSPAVPRGTKVRNALSDLRRRDPIANCLYALRDRALVRRYRTTDWFFSVRTVWPGLGGREPDDILALSDTDSVEVMVHPSFPDEQRELTSGGWHEALSVRRLGTFADL